MVKISPSVSKPYELQTRSPGASSGGFRGYQAWQPWVIAPVCQLQQFLGDFSRVVTCHYKVVFLAIPESLLLFVFL